MSPPPPEPRKVRLKTLLYRYRIALVIAAAVALVLILLIGGPFWRLAGQLDGRIVSQPSRLYARSLELRTGAVIPPDQVVAELEALDYRRVDQPEGLGVGEFYRGDRALAVRLRSFWTADGRIPPSALEVRFRGSRVDALRWRGEEVEVAYLEPPLLASFYGPQVEERRPVLMDEVPTSLVQSVLAVEDDGFFDHSGLSITGIARAAWVNLTGGEVRQGGSTLTQQLVKNIYLSHERTLSRKAQEAVLAVLVELRYDKDTILRSYLNEIYLGRGDGANLIGVGAAAHAYFGKQVAELTLAESATLAGMIRSPANYSPLTHPDSAQSRRDVVLQRLEELEWIEPEVAEAARQQPMEARKGSRPVRRAPYFASLVEEEAARRFGLEELADAGYVLLSTLEPKSQENAESAVAWGLESLEKGWEKNHKGDGPLQAALVSIDVEDGGILAYVGGRDFAASQFDRASQARRQAGSAFKPVVYAAAFEAGAAAPSSLVEDAPLTITLAGRRWQPRNSDNTFDGWMSVRTAVERSRNVPTVRLALQVGLPRIVEMARGLGISARLEPLPSLALGAFEVTPLEMTSVYGTLAAGGTRPPIHGLDAVFDPAGEKVEGQPLPAREEIIQPQTAYLLTSVLQGVFDRGTAQRARRDGLDAPLAGKTGTTNDRRDSWFGGYSRDRATVVWVGYDDNDATRLSGSRAALPIWSRFTQSVRPAGGFGTFTQPSGISTATIDPETGELATDDCPEVITEVFLAGHEPQAVCSLHGSWRDRWQQRREAGDDGGRHPFRRWFDRVFRGRGGEEEPEPERDSGVY